MSLNRNNTINKKIEVKEYYKITLMDKRINAKLQQHISTFKNDLKNEVMDLINTNPGAKNELEHIMQFVYAYEGYELSQEDFVKRKRVKNVVAQYDRCCAKRANGEQCSRRRLSNSTFCGTHIKGTPHGVINIDAAVPNTTEKVDILIQEIKGIYYYLDNKGNVYKPEDIVTNKSFPSVIAQYTCVDGKYAIPELNV
tara:strand:+ start:138 stop:728 length:591 start_codon:yes stop_codon:yes gene_type:complete